MKTEIKRKFPQATLFDEISSRAAAGKEGALWVRHNTQSGELQLCTGSRRWPVLKLHLNLRDGAGVREVTEETFAGELVIDDRGDGREKVRLVLIDEAPQVVLNSGGSELEGSIFIVALRDAQKGTPFCVSALFRTRLDRDGQSSILWSSSCEALFFLDLLDEMRPGTLNNVV